jgi:DNA invertase Pin-like site-specific DNA recombinase
MKLGRPPIPDETRARVRELRKQGLGYKRIANELGLGRTTVRRLLGEMTGPSERYVPVGMNRSTEPGAFSRKSAKDGERDVRDGDREA